MSSSIRELNIRQLGLNQDCQLLLQKMREVEEFMEDFSFLSLGRDHIICDRWSLSLQRIITSVKLTAGNIISCCESACIADANALLRKYRDDLFFYLYIVVFDANCKLTNSSDETERMKKHITNWIKNGLSNLSVNEVLRAIGRSPNVNGAVVKYKLQAYFTDIGKRLNSYVHSNGYAYYNLNINAYKDDELYEKMNALLCDMKLITITFLLLLILCSPLSVMSNDYIDFLDSNMEPPSGAQYWVAPFAEDFIKENICLIDKSCINYLQDNTPMQFSL